MRRAALVVLPALVAVLAGTLLLPATVHAAPPAAAAVALAAPRCAASIEDAARGILGGSGIASNDGFRVQDLVVDPVLRKAWLRIADCHDARKPLTLVPLAANLAVGLSVAAAPVVPAANLDAAHRSECYRDSVAAPATQAPMAPMLIARGDAVEVFVQSANVRMTLEGHAASAAAAGESVDVVLDSSSAATTEPNTPARHLRGIATAAHRVEVQR